MPRVERGFKARRRRKKYLKLAKGFVGGRRKLYTVARETVEKGLGYAFRDRKVRKRDFRRLWIVRINAAARAEGISYSRLIAGLNKAEIEKVMQEIEKSTNPRKMISLEDAIAAGAK